MSVKRQKLYNNEQLLIRLVTNVYDSDLTRTRYHLLSLRYIG